MAVHPRPHLSIAFRTTVSSPIFDLAQQIPFTISLTFTLIHTCPITFNPRFTTIFDGNILYKGGLTFTNIVTGELVPRNTRDVSYISSSDDGATSSEQTKNSFLALDPGKEDVLHATLQSSLRHSMSPTQDAGRGGVSGWD
jgi:hypothetical protein